MISVLAIPTQSAAQDSRLFVTVTGRDQDSVAFPLSGVTLRVTRIEDGALVKTATTDGLGFVEIVVPSQQKYLITGTLEGYAPILEARGVEISPRPGDVAVGLQLSLTAGDPGPDVGTTGPALGGIFGRVLLTDGTPLPSTRLEVRGTSFESSTQTANDGSFRLQAVSGVYTIQSPGTRRAFRQGAVVGAKTGVYPSPVRVVTGRMTGPVDLILEPLQLFRVVVIVMNELGDGVPGAQIEYWGSESGGYNMSTSENGTVTTGPFPSDTKHMIIATSGDAKFAGLASVEVQETDQEVSIVLSPAATLSGRVEFEGRSRPLQSRFALQVSARPPDARGSGDSRRAVVDPDGGFTLPGLVGDMCLSLDFLPFPWVVRDVALQGLDVTNKILTFKSGEQTAGLLFRVEEGDGRYRQAPKCMP